MTSIAFLRFRLWLQGEASLAYPIVPPQRKKLEACSEGEQGDVTRLLDCQAELALVAGANAGQATRNDLATLGNEALKQGDAAGGGGVGLVGLELAHLR